MMARLSPGRKQSENRNFTTLPRPATEQFKTYPAPVRGWVTNQNLLMQDKMSAVILDNFFPTETGVSPRGGIAKFVDIPAKCEFLFDYNLDNIIQYFAATSTAIYKFTDSDSGNSITTAAVSGQTSSDYSFVNMVNSGGNYLKLVNGADSEQIYNGTSWSVPSITGVNTNLLSHIWLYGKRAFYIQKNSMSAWYLGIDAIQGAATELPLAGIFKHGGSLLFGTTFSTDSGEGLDDLCVFVTTNGEAAIYSGNPADTTWALQGVYYVGYPIGKNAFFHVGGDPVIATKEGLIPLSSAIQKNRSQAKLDSLSFDIEPTYNFEVLNSGAFSRWMVSKWGTADKLFVAPPLNSNLGKGFVFVKNLKTNAWCRYTGWDVQTMAVMNDLLWIGDGGGNVFKADIGGLDDGADFECRLAYAFDNLGTTGRFKETTRLKETWRYSTNFESKRSVATDYQNNFQDAPNVAAINAEGQGAWDTSPWDTTQWGTDGQASYKVKEDWGTVNASGENFSIQLQVTSGSSAKLDIELVSVDLGYRVGENLA
ncbi:MAG: hypothetical protein AAF621_00540 [Pseudomonadota bacterium]